MIGVVKAHELLLERTDNSDWFVQGCYHLANVLVRMAEAERAKNSCGAAHAILEEKIRVPALEFIHSQPSKEAAEEFLQPVLLELNTEQHF